MSQIWIQIIVFWKSIEVFCEKLLKTDFFQYNIFNFILMIIIFIVIYRVCHIGSILESGIQKIKDTINDSKKAKENSIDELKEAQEKVSNVQEEIKEIEQRNIEIIAKSEEKIQKETEKQIENLNYNANKIISSKEREAVSKLSKETVIASIELAKEHIKSMLKKNPKLHQEFIDESIKELDRLNYEQQK